MQEELGKGGGNNMLLMMGLGFVAGAATGLLLAPAHGRETRRRLGELGRKASEAVDSGIQQVSTTIGQTKAHLQHAVGDMKHAAGDVKTAGVRVSNEIQDRLSESQRAR